LQHVIEATRQRGSETPHTQDLILTTDNCLSEIEYLNPFGISDHSVLKLDYKFIVEKCKTDDKFQLDKGCYDQLIDYLDINWDEMLESPNETVDENWEKSVLLKGMNMFIPKRKKSPRKWKKNFHPFNKQLIHKNTDSGITGSRPETNCKKIRNKVKSVTVKLTQQEQ